MTDLRALLGDKYEATVRAAVLADNPEAITSAQQVGGKLGQLMYLSAVDRLDRTLAAVLPDLLADAWDEAVASMRYEDGTPVQLVSVVNPYRIDTEEPA